MSKSEKWPYTIGDRPNTVSVYERGGPGGILYGRIWDPTLGSNGSYRKESLGHRDRERAIAWAADQHAKLVKGEQDALNGILRPPRLFALYLKHRSPRKAETTQDADERRVEMFTRFLGASKNVSKLTLREWESFIDLRSSGAIDARGNRIPEGERTEVRPRTVRADLKWLNAVLNWGTRWTDDHGRYLLGENPVRGFDLPDMPNVRRPVASQDRVEAVLAVAERVTTQYRWGGKAERRPSPLRDILVVVAGTGRRLSSVLALRYDDLLPDEGPYGSIRWRAETDKTDRETIVPIGPSVRRAFERRMAERPGIGGALLFPSPSDPTKPVSRDLARSWLLKAEKLAGLEKQGGSLWHAYRRKWATERKHLPAADVAEAGGWKGVQSLQTAYMRADKETILRVVLEAGELREVR